MRFEVIYMNASLWVIIGSAVVIFIMIMLIIAVCVWYCKCSRKRWRKRGPEEPSLSTDQLIPPIFMYTDGMKDPLYQADLVEKIRS